MDLRVTVRTTVLLLLPARRHLTALLKVDDGSPLTELLRLSYEGESPHKPGPRLRTARPGTDQGARRPVLKGVGEGQFSVPDPPPAEVHEMVSARLPTPDEASTLRINTALAVLAITRVAADNTGRVIEAALLVFPGDRVDAVFSTHHVIE